MRIASIFSLATSVSIATFAALGSLTLSLVFPVQAAAQEKPAAPHRKVLGYQDPETGVFHPLMRVQPEVTTAPTTGTFELTITITLKTAVPAGGSVYCTTEIDANSTNLDTDASTEYLETAYSVAKVTGSTATCTVTTPYSWILAKESSTVQNSLNGIYSVGILPASSSSTSPSVLDGRTSSGPFGGTTIPATGAITKYTVDVTL